MKNSGKREAEKAALRCHGLPPASNSFRTTVLSVLCHELTDDDFDKSPSDAALLFVSGTFFERLPRLPLFMRGSIGDFTRLERLLAMVVMDFIIAMVVTTSWELSS